MNIELPVIQLAEPSNVDFLANLAEETFRDAFARFINRDDFENYVARSFSENLCDRFRYPGRLHFYKTDTAATSAAKPLLTLRKLLQLPAQWAMTLAKITGNRRSNYLQKVGVHKDSMCNDIENKTPIEIDFLDAKVVGYARANGLSAPFYVTMTNRINSIENRYLDP